MMITSGLKVVPPGETGPVVRVAMLPETGTATCCGGVGEMQLWQYKNNNNGKNKFAVIPTENDDG